MSLDQRQKILRKFTICRLDSDLFRSAGGRPTTKTCAFVEFLRIPLGGVRVLNVFPCVRDALGIDVEGPFAGKLETEFHKVTITSDSGLLAFRELDDAFRLTEEASSILSDNRRGKNTQHSVSATLA